MSASSAPLSRATVGRKASAASSSNKRSMDCPRPRLSGRCSFLGADILDLYRAELGTQLQRRGGRLRLRRADGHAVDLVLDLVAGDDDLERVPFAFLDVLVLLVARHDVELGAAQEHVVV